MTAPARLSPGAKLRQDLEAWSRATGKPVSVALALRLALLEPGFQLALSLRLQESLGRLPLVGRLLRRLLWYMTTIWTSCHIAPGATFGGGLYLPHPTGIVIGAGTRIGRDVAIYQQVTLGRRDTAVADVPVVGDHCQLGAGARILGAVTLGDHVTIGANAVVLTDIPSGHIAVGIPARIVSSETPDRAIGQPEPDAVPSRVRS